MIKATNDQIGVLAQAAVILSELVSATEAVLEPAERHVTDRLGITVAELGMIVKDLREHGVLDKELLDGVNDVMLSVFTNKSLGIPMYFVSPDFYKSPVPRG